jgi:hypothetical protein
MVLIIHRGNMEMRVRMGDEERQGTGELRPFAALLGLQSAEHSMTSCTQ